MQDTEPGYELDAVTTTTGCPSCGAVVDGDIAEGHVHCGCGYRVNLHVTYPS
jgi:hypothetical protein